MKNPFTKFFLLIIILLIPLCIKNYAQIPPHPLLLEKVKRGEIAIPYTLSNLDLIRSKGVDEPWSSPELKLLKKTEYFFEILWSKQGSIRQLESISHIS